MIDPRDYPALTLKEALARQAIEKLVPRAVRQLQQLQEDHLLSGEDSGLRDVWDEICVQVQYELSPQWSSYRLLIERVILRLMQALPPTSLHALWLETEAGQEWADEVEGTAASTAPSSPTLGVDLPYDTDDVVVCLRDHVISAAGDWSNARIDRYLARR